MAYETRTSIDTGQEGEEVNMGGVTQ
jgi:hypothetical protein